MAYGLGMGFGNWNPFANARFQGRPLFSPIAPQPQSWNPFVNARFQGTPLFRQGQLNLQNDPYALMAANAAKPQPGGVGYENGPGVAAGLAAPPMRVHLGPKQVAPTYATQSVPVPVPANTQRIAVKRNVRTV